MTVEWRPAQFASHFRRQDPEPPVARWEDVLQAEQSLTHRLVTLFARSSWLRRLLGLPAHLGSFRGSSLAAREERARAIAGTPVARAIERLLGPRRQQPRLPEAQNSGLPPIGPVLNHEIDKAVTLLASMTFQEIQNRGWHWQPNHYYWPLNDLEFLRANPQIWANPELPRGIDWGLDDQMELAQRLAKYSGELADVGSELPARPGEFAWGQALRAPTPTPTTDCCVSSNRLASSRSASACPASSSTGLSAR